MKGLILLAVAIAIIPLISVLGDVVTLGLPAISWSFFTENPPSPLAGYGGIWNGIVGSSLMVGMGTLVALPL